MPTCVGDHPVRLRALVQVENTQDLVRAYPGMVPPVYLALGVLAQASDPSNVVIVLSRRIIHVIPSISCSSSTKVGGLRYTR